MPARSGGCWESVGRRPQLGGRDLSNSDNMALVGVLSTQLLHQQFVVRRPGGLGMFQLTVDIDREHRVEAALS